MLFIRKKYIQVSLQDVIYCKKVENKFQAVIYLTIFKFANQNYIQVKDSTHDKW